MSLKNTAVEIAQNPKAGATVSTATTWSGVGTILDLIPNDIGKLATIVGIVLSVILIYANLLRIRRERFELEVLKRRERERLSEMQQSCDPPKYSTD